MTALSDAIQALRANDEQWEAFNTDGHCVVLAPPGSGKTQLLTTKLADACAREIIRSPRGAACITMTNEAAFELRTRLRRLGIPTNPNLFVGTVHAFALGRIVLPFAAAAGRADLATSRQATDAEWDEIFDGILAQSGFRPDQRDQVYTTMQKARQRLDLSGNRLFGGEPIAAIAKRFQVELEARGLFDFHDLVRHAVALVEEVEWVPRVLAATYPRVYVDEYQDLAPGLDRIVRSFTLSTGYESTLFAVGDPDQSIYGFSGSHPELLERLAREAGVHRVRLKTNYRSGQAIIDVSLRALGEAREIRSDRDGGRTRLHPAPGGPTAQALVATGLVIDAISRGVEHENIAVIAPWGSDRDLCVDALREQGVPVYARTDEYWRASPVMTLIEAAASWAAHRQESGVNLYDLLENFATIVLNGRKQQARRAFVEVLLEADPGSSASVFVESLTEIALRGLVADETADEDSRELARMRRALAPGGRAAAMTVADLGARARAPGRVMAATIHGAKGLEFDVVVMVGVDDACLPGFNPSEEDAAEARRKFYVTLTRARDEVDLVYTDSRISKRGRTYPVAPSPFVTELQITSGG